MSLFRAAAVECNIANIIHPSITQQARCQPLQLPHQAADGVRHSNCHDIVADDMDEIVASTGDHETVDRI